MMKNLKKQLKTNGLELNKLKQSSLNDNWMLAPIHAAVKSNSIEIFKLVSETKGLDPNSVSVIKDESGILNCGVLECAILEEGWSNVEIVKLILDVENLFLTFCELVPGHTIANCLSLAVGQEHLGILDVLYSKADKIDALSPFFSLMTAVIFNKRKVFTHVLPQAKKVIRFCSPFLNMKDCTLLDFPQSHGRADMCKQLVKAGGYTAKQIATNKLFFIVNTIVNNDFKINPNDQGTDCGPTEKSDPVKICWNCSRTGDAFPLYKYKGCKKARYCNDKCQEEDWKVHADYCRKKMKKRALKLKQLNDS